MFGIGLPELLLILVLALIVFGPDRLPQIARQIARFVVGLKKASEEFKSQLDLNEALKDIEDPKAPGRQKDTKSPPEMEEKKRD
ncbi:MAG: twin-arginine translocase subunit TatB [Nitrospiraceae bacterium]|nr:twin-arginine translocase subunit TatB [Nitrospiraceae bacterium]